MREPGNVNRKSSRSYEEKGATGGHYLHFLNDTMNIMDEFPEMKGHFIVMDNARIHIPEAINPIIINRGYTPVYIPP